MNQVSGSRAMFDMLQFLGSLVVGTGVSAAAAYGVAAWLQSGLRTITHGKEYAGVGVFIGGSLVFLLCYPTAGAIGAWATGRMLRFRGRCWSAWRFAWLWFLYGVLAGCLLWPLLAWFASLVPVAWPVLDRGGHRQQQEASRQDGACRGSRARAKGQEVQRRPVVAAS
jgi:hypothetical protein